MNISLIAAHAEKERLEREAREGWEQVAQALSDKIPQSLHTFASQPSRGWFKDGFDNDWRYPGLPSFLNEVVRSVHASITIKLDELERNGFTDADDFYAKMAELNEAWAGTVIVSPDPPNPTDPRLVGVWCRPVMVRPSQQEATLEPE